MIEKALLACHVLWVNANAQYYRATDYLSSPDLQSSTNFSAQDRIRIHYVCYGNICRSPFAEYYTRNIIQDDHIAAQSSGFFDETGRTSPSVAVDAAKDFGVDLSSHTSNKITPDSASNADLVVLMDFKNKYHLSQLPTNSTNDVMLGYFNNSTSQIRIPDPYGHNREDFIRTYSRIADAIDDLIHSLDINR